MANEFKIRNGLVVETIPGSSTQENILVHNSTSGLIESRTTLATSSIENFNANVSASAAASGFGNFDTTGTGIVSGSSQISYTGITDVPSGIISGSTQIDALGFYNSGDNATFASLNITNDITASGLTSNGSERTPLVIDGSGNIYIGADYTADTGDGSVDMVAPDTANAIIVANASGSKELKQIDATADFKNQDIQNLGSILGSSIVSSSQQVQNYNTFLEITGDNVISSSVQVDYTQISNVPSGIVSGSEQVSFNDITDKPTLFSGSEQVDYNNIQNQPTLFDGNYSSLTGVPSGIVSGSTQIDYTQISNVPSGIVSGSSQISFNGITDKPTLFSGSSQVDFNSISNVPSGIVSGSSQVDYTQISNVPSGIVSGAAQIDALGFYNEGDNPTFGTVNADTLIANQYIVSSSVTYLTQSFSSGSTKFGDSFDDIHQFTGSVSISGSGDVTGNLTLRDELIVTGSGIALFQVGDDGILKHTTAGATNIGSNSTIVSLNETSYTSLHLNYYLRNNTQDAYRAGNVVYVWNSNNSTYELSEVSTTDLGTPTSGIEFSGSMSGGNFNAELNVTSGTWVVRIKGSAL